MGGWYARRAVAWLPLLVLTSAGALLGVVQVGRSDGWEPLAYALFGLVPAAACLADEPAAAVVDSGPSTLRWRTASRAYALLIPASAHLGLSVWVAGRPGAPAALLIADGWILILLAFAATVMLRRAGHDTPSRIVAPAAVLVLTADLMLRSELPAALGLLNVESHAPGLRLAALAAVVLLLVLWGSRDFLSRGPGEPAWLRT